MIKLYIPGQSKIYLPEPLHTWENGICIECGATIEDVRANSIDVLLTQEEINKLKSESHHKGGEVCQEER